MKKNDDLTKRKELKDCLACGSKCCRYLTVNIPTPRSIADFDQLFWQISHENAQAFKDERGWFLLIFNPCKHLKPDGMCAIYESRPFICREHSLEDCERNGSIVKAADLFFKDHKALERYCKKRFKHWGRRFDSR